MYVCKHCLMAIEAHEGQQNHRHITWEDVPEEQIIVVDDEEMMVCEWCEEEIPLDEMVEI